MRLAALVLLLVSNTPSTLHIQYVAGKKISYSLTMNMDVEAGGKKTHAQTVTGTTVETHAVASDGTAEQHLRVDKMDATGATLPSMAGIELVYSQDPRARVTARQPATGGTAQQQAVLNALMNSIDQVNPTLPDKPVQVGDSWTDHRTIDLPLGAAMKLPLTVDSTLTLRKVDGTVVTMGLAVAVSMQKAIGDTTMTAGGTVAGTVTIDLDGGATTMKTDGDLTMTIATPITMHYTLEQVKAP